VRRVPREGLEVEVFQLARLGLDRELLRLAAYLCTQRSAQGGIAQQMDDVL
jgi:hypothetical protein